MKDLYNAANALRKAITPDTYGPKAPAMPVTPIAPVPVDNSRAQGLAEQGAGMVPVASVVKAVAAPAVVPAHVTGPVAPKLAAKPSPAPVAQAQAIPAATAPPVPASTGSHAYLPADGTWTPSPGMTNDALINGAGARIGVPPTLLRSLIGLESGGSSTSTSPVGAAGAGQFMPETAAGIQLPWKTTRGIDSRNNSEAIPGAAVYLKQGHDAAVKAGVSDTDAWRFALAHYHGGPGAMQVALRGGTTWAGGEAALRKAGIRDSNMLTADYVNRIYGSGGGADGGVQVASASLPANLGVPLTAPENPTDPGAPVLPVAQTQAVIAPAAQSFIPAVSPTFTPAAPQDLGREAEIAADAVSPGFSGTWEDRAAALAQSARGLGAKAGATLSDMARGVPAFLQSGADAARNFAGNLVTQNRGLGGQSPLSLLATGLTLMDPKQTVTDAMKAGQEALALGHQPDKQASALADAQQSRAYHAALTGQALDQPGQFRAGLQSADHIAAQGQKGENQRAVLGSQTALGSAAIAANKALQAAEIRAAGAGAGTGNPDPHRFDSPVDTALNNAFHGPITITSPGQIGTAITNIRNALRMVPGARGGNAFDELYKDLHDQARAANPGITNPTQLDAKVLPMLIDFVNNKFRPNANAPLVLPTAGT